jgi:hypothetical protein
VRPDAWDSGAGRALMLKGRGEVELREVRYRFDL